MNSLIETLLDHIDADAGHMRDLRFADFRESAAERIQRNTAHIRSMLDKQEQEKKP